MASPAASCRRYVHPSAIAPFLRYASERLRRGSHRYLCKKGSRYPKKKFILLNKKEE